MWDWKTVFGVFGIYAEFSFHPTSKQDWTQYQRKWGRGKTPLQDDAPAMNNLAEKGLDI